MIILLRGSLDYGDWVGNRGNILFLMKTVKGRHGKQTLSNTTFSFASMYTKWMHPWSYQDQEFIWLVIR